MTLPNKDVSAVVLTTGEPTTQEAIDRLHQQTLPLCEVIVIRDVRPFHKALNAGAARVVTPFFLQIDADMLLDAHCAASLRRSMRRNVGIAVGHLRDALLGQVLGVKLFRTSCFEAARFENTLSPDTDFVDDIARAGWNTIYIGQLPRASTEAWRTFGEHRREYSWSYTYRKFTLEGARYGYRRKPAGFRWYLGALQESRHPARFMAQTALVRGLFMRENCDLLGLGPEDEDFALIQDFLSKEEERSVPDVAGPRVDVPERDLFGAYYRLGTNLISLGAASAFKGHMQRLGNVRDDGVLLCKIALCCGLYAPQGEAPEELIAADFELVARFLGKPQVRASSVAPTQERERSDSHDEQSSLEAITSYAHRKGLKSFFVDEDPPAEYQIDLAADQATFRKTSRVGASVIDRNGRPRIMLPFTPFGQMICTRPERLTGIFWCMDLLRAGYASVHELTLTGQSKTWVMQKLAINLLGRIGLNQSVPAIPSLPEPGLALERLVRSTEPSYEPVPGRVLMVTSSFALGGSERQMVAVTSALMERGYDVRMMALSPMEPECPTVDREIMQLGLQPLTPADFAESVPRSDGTSDAGDWSRLPAWLSRRSQQVELAIRQLRPSILHGWLDVPALAAAVAGCRLGVPRIAIAQASLPEHIHNFAADASDVMWNAYQAVNRNPAVTIVNNSLIAARAYELWLRFPASTIRLLPNCFWPQRMRIPAAEERSELKATLGLPSGAPIVGTIMRLVPDKDPELWVDTAAMIAETRPDIRFVIAGTGPLQPLIVSRIQRLGLTEKFRLPGAVTDVGLMYSLFDVFLLTSNIEGVPNVLIEAQAAGRPVVTTNVGGTSEAVMDGVTGTVVSERSAEHLARAVIAILADPAFGERARIAGPRLIAERFDGDRIVDQLLGIYGEPAGEGLRANPPY